MSKSSEIAFIFLTNNRNLSGFELYFNAKSVFIYIYIYNSGSTSLIPIVPILCERYPAQLGFGQLLAHRKVRTYNYGQRSWGKSTL